MRRSVLVIVLMVVFLFGCTGSREYVAITDEPYDLENAKAICKEATTSKVRMVTQFGYLPVSNPVTDIISAFLMFADKIVEQNDKPLYDECMKSKGWVEK